MKHFEELKSAKSFLNRYYGTLKCGIMMHKSTSPFSFSYKEDYYNKAEYLINEVNEVDAVEITMPEVEFERLIDEHEQLKNLKNLSGLDSVEVIMNDYGLLKNQYFTNLNEKRIRDSNESVKKAYEHYQMLLNLAK